MLCVDTVRRMTLLPLVSPDSIISMSVAINYTAYYVISGVQTIIPQYKCI